MIDLDAFADIHNELYEAARRAKVPPLLPLLLVELAAQCSPGAAAVAIARTESARGLLTAAGIPARRADLTRRLFWTPVNPTVASP